MNIYGLLSWYDEDPDHLRRCVRSLEGFVDVLVALDGAYATYPDARAQSDPQQGAAVVNASTLKLVYPMVERPWASEVEKRAQMFRYGRLAGATADDWFLIVDADMTLAAFSPGTRDKLAATDRDVAEVRWHDVQVDGKQVSTYAFRSMFRALPGLTVERTHFLYTVPTDAGRRFLWHTPDGHISLEPALDLTEHVTLHHFNSSRCGERKRAALAYYKDRDARHLEDKGDWQ